METSYWIARLRRLIDLWEAEANRLGDHAIEQEGAMESRLLSGRSLGIMFARGSLLELLRELVAAEARLRQR